MIALDRPTLKFPHKLGECDTQEWVSNRQYSEYDEITFHLVIRLLDMERLTGEDREESKYIAEICVVNPNLPINVNVRRELSEEETAGAIFEDGNYASVWQTSGNNPMLLMYEARKQTEHVARCLSRYLDKPINRIGTTAWEILRF